MLNALTDKLCHVQTQSVIGMTPQWLQSRIFAPREDPDPSPKKQAINGMAEYWYRVSAYQN